MDTPAKTAIVKNNPRTLNAWAMYDWANSTYALVIGSAIFPAYYNEVTKTGSSTRVQVLGLDFENTAIYSITLGLAFGLVALISPLLSSISDYRGNHKTFMKFFCYLGGLSCMALYFFKGPNIYLGLGGLALATIGYSGSIVYYNAFLPAIATPDRHDRVSARGYAFGYIGSTIMLIGVLVILFNAKALGITDGTFVPRLALLVTGLWWVGFAQIPFARLPKGAFVKKKREGGILQGYQELRKVWSNLKQEGHARNFLVAFFFYIMGVQTVMFMAASFGNKEIGLQQAQLIATVISLEFLAIAGAYLFAWLSGRFGNVPALITAVSMWVGITIAALFIRTPLHFYMVAFFIGLVMGGIQSLSRSTYAKMIPKTHNNAGYFSFYDVCEKLGIMLGLVMFGYLDDLMGSMRYSIVSLTVWFVIGLALLIRLYRRGQLPVAEESVVVPS